jgi:signal transduction histidine kinase/ligand-binding sensor domain-containing protein/DNA-binding response OmpR family regulator
MRIAFTIFCLLLFFSSTYSQPAQYHFLRLNANNGLSNNEVNCIFKDELGFMWFGTRSGLNRFDGYSFKVFKHDLRDTSSIADEEISQLFEGPEHTIWINTKSKLEIYNLLTETFNHCSEKIMHSYGIPDSSILDLKKDKKGNFWFLTASAGLYKYDPVKKLSLRFDDDDGTAKNRTTGFALTENNEVWVVKSNSLIKKLDAQTGRIIFSTTKLQSLTAEQTFNYAIYADADNDLWIYTPGVTNGIFYYNLSGDKILHIKKGSNNKSLNNEMIRNIVQDENGLIWIATDHGGVNMLNKKTFTFSYLQNQQDDNYSLSQNSIDVLFVDNSGVVWIGTFKKGICYYYKNMIKFPLFHNQPSDAASLPFNDVNRFAEDANGNIWIGTNGAGLLYFNRATGKYTQYKHDPSNPNSLCNDVIVSLCIDHNKTLWIGTYFSGLDNFNGKTFTHYKHSNTDTLTIADNAIWSVMEDSSHRLWIGTFSSGLDIMDLATKKFMHYKPSWTTYVQSTYVCHSIQARNGDIWIATSTGVDVVKKATGNIIHYVHDKAKPLTSLSDDNTIALLQDSRGIIWVATREGLDYFNPEKQTFTTLRKEDGLADNIIVSVIEDAEHNIWAGTSNGLTNIIVNEDDRNSKLNFKFKNYNEADGLQDAEFNEYSALAAKDGTLFFGGANGFNMFKPQQINSAVFKPQLVLTDLQMFNKSVRAGEYFNNHIILPQSISETKSISLKYNENIFSIEFAALNFFNKSKLRYAYTLQGFNNEWFIADDKARKATYTNLDPGNYVFKVRMIDENGVWSRESVSLNIEILPPFWKTYFAYIVYIILFVAALYFCRRVIVKRAHARFALEHERKEAQRIHELDMMKIKFFTNISHEFRTPLSLILTPMDKIVRNTVETTQKHQLQMVQRNARRLLNLVNQLLDFRQMGKSELKLHASEGDIIGFIKDVADSFIDIAEKKHIAFAFNASEKKLYTSFDQDKIERVLLNLLSNAFKFTPDYGSVSVILNTCNTKDHTMLYIKVCDSGIGISKHMHEKIFYHFVQSDIPANMLNQGSGIGLSIAEEFVKLHNGNITVESELGKGSCFTVSLPLQQIEMISQPVITNIGLHDETEVLEESPSICGLDNALSAGKNLYNGFRKPAILIVEDNEDLRSYLKENLRRFFNISEAVNGKAGWQKALSIHPDLIISDINMAEMNGIDLCRKIKGDKRTSFVPVILLTAATEEEQQLLGLSTGASDYITKPFNFEVLVSKINNLLTHQEMIKRTYQKQVTVIPAAIPVETPEENFVQRVLSILEKEIANAGFSVEELSRELFMSRVAVYKKLLALTGETPLEFIRSFRLKRAAQLLENNLTVAEVAYRVGFNNPKYFSKFFKSEFNILPSAYQVMIKAKLPVKENNLKNTVIKDEEITF